MITLSLETAHDLSAKLTEAIFLAQEHKADAICMDKTDEELNIIVPVNVKQSLNELRVVVNLEQS